MWQFVGVGFTSWCGCNVVNVEIVRAANAWTGYEFGTAVAGCGADGHVPGAVDEDIFWAAVDFVFVFIVGFVCLLDGDEGGSWCW